MMMVNPRHAVCCWAATRTVLAFVSRVDERDLHGMVHHHPVQATLDQRTGKSWSAALLRPPGHCGVDPGNGMSGRLSLTQRLCPGRPATLLAQGRERGSTVLRHGCGADSAVFKNVPLRRF